MAKRRTAGQLVAEGHGPWVRGSVARTSDPRTILNRRGSADGASGPARPAAAPRG